MGKTIKQLKVFIVEKDDFPVEEMTDAVFERIAEKYGYMEMAVIIAKSVEENLFNYDYPYVQFDENMGRLISYKW